MERACTCDVYVMNLIYLALLQTLVLPLLPPRNAEYATEVLTSLARNAFKSQPCPIRVLLDLLQAEYSIELTAMNAFGLIVCSFV